LFIDEAFDGFRGLFAFQHSCNVFRQPVLER
jgi:hypothetical protein